MGYYVKSKLCDNEIIAYLYDSVLQRYNIPRQYIPQNTIDDRPWSPLFPLAFITETYPPNFEEVSILLDIGGKRNIDDRFLYTAKRGDSTKLLRLLKTRYQDFKITPTKLKRIMKQLVKKLIFLVPTFINLNYIGWIPCHNSFEHFPASVYRNESLGNIDASFDYNMLIYNQINWPLIKPTEVNSLVHQTIDYLQIADFSNTVEMFCTSLFSVIRSLYMPDSNSDIPFSFSINSDKLTTDELTNLTRFFCGSFMYNNSNKDYYRNFYDFKFRYALNNTSGMDIHVITESYYNKYKIDKSSLLKALSDKTIYIFIGLRSQKELLPDLSFTSIDETLYQAAINNPEHMPSVLNAFIQCVYYYINSKEMAESIIIKGGKLRFTAFNELYKKSLKELRSRKGKKDPILLRKYAYLLSALKIWISVTEPYVCSNDLPKFISTAKLLIEKATNAFANRCLGISNSITIDAPNKSLSLFCEYISSLFKESFIHATGAYSNAAKGWYEFSKAQEEYFIYLKYFNYFEEYKEFCKQKSYYINYSKSDFQNKVLYELNIVELQHNSEKSGYPRFDVRKVITPGNKVSCLKLRVNGLSQFGLDIKPFLCD